MNEHDGPWLTLREAARHIRTSVGFIRRHLSEIPHTRAGGKLLRFRLADLDAWLQENVTARRRK